MDKKYWQEYYKNKGAPHQPSNFARFALEEFMNDRETLIELGCGNGRDSLFFARHDINVTAVDQIDIGLASLAAQENLTNMRYLCADFTKLGKMDLFNFVYSRFTFHSISEKEEDDVIKWSYKHLKDGGKLLIEARGRKNELYRVGKPVQGEPHAYTHENHYRRFIDVHALEKKLIDAGFKILMAEEESGFAPHGDTDQVFIRVIASKE